MTHVACRLTAKDRDQLRDPTLGYRVRASVTFLCGEGVGAAAAEQRADISALERLHERRLASSAVSEHHNAHSLERLAGHGQLTTAHLAAVSHQRLHHNNTLQTPPPVLLPGVSPGCALAGTDGLPADDGISRRGLAPATTAAHHHNNSTLVHTADFAPGAAPWCVTRMLERLAS